MEKKVQVETLKFDIETITDLLLTKIEELHPENSGLALIKYQEISEQFEQVKHIKQKNGLATLDLVLVYENHTGQLAKDKLDSGYDGYKNVVTEIYKRLDYKLQHSKKVTLYTRGGAEGIPTFHFPAEMNLWVLSNNNFLKTQIKPLVLVNIGIEGRWDLYKEKMLPDSTLVFVENNPWFDYDKHVDENWRDDNQHMTDTEKAEYFGQEQNKKDEHGIERKYTVGFTGSNDG